MEMVAEKLARSPNACGSLPRGSTNQYAHRVSQSRRSRKPNRSCRPILIVSKAISAGASSSIVKEEDASNCISIASSEFKKGTYTVCGVLQSSAGPETAYGVLEDIGNSHNIYRNIEDSRIWFTENGEKRLTEDCGWSFLIFRGAFPVTLDVQEDPQNRLLEFNMVEGKFMHKMIGRWQVFPQNGGGSIIHHTLSVKPIVVAPPPIGNYTSRIFAKQVTQILEDLSGELEKQTG